VIFMEILPVVDHVCCIPNALKHTNLWHGFKPCELGAWQLERLTQICMQVPQKYACILDSNLSNPQSFL
jgi:hypothetical protein